MIDVQGNGNGAAASNFTAPYVQQWNLDLQRQFRGDFLVDIAYAGSKGTHLPKHSQDLDQLPPQSLPQSASDVTNPDDSSRQPVCRKLHGMHWSGDVWRSRNKRDRKGSSVAICPSRSSMTLPWRSLITGIRFITRCS